MDRNHGIQEVSQQMELPEIETFNELYWGPTELEKVHWSIQ